MKMVKTSVVVVVVAVFAVSLQAQGALPKNLKGVGRYAVILKSSVASIYEGGEKMSFQHRGDRMTHLRSQLIQYSAQTQAGIISILEEAAVPYKSFWITNRLFVSNPTPGLLKQLASNPSVASIREEIVLPLFPVTKSSEGDKMEKFPAVRGVHIVKARALWDEGFAGEGVVVSNIDTGVRGTHRILRDNFVGAYGWYDPSGRSAAPRDDNGHGTHTMGTIAGREGFGVAPNSTWMACMGCAGSSCYESDLLSCGEFIACPFLANGSSPDCSKSPHVVGNSWGSSLGGQDWYDDVIRGFHAANVIPVFSAGNSGPNCGSVGSPGDREGVIGVAATDMEDNIASFSSRGPTTDGRQKPEIAAPGVKVLSSVNLGDEAFDSYDGTSMASPHVTGGIALLLQKHPGLIGNYEGVRRALFQGAHNESLTGSNQNCGGLDDATFPNMVFGHGRLDLAASAK